eukprot:6210336-Pyramimonas_sp.AAC.1
MYSLAVLAGAQFGSPPASTPASTPASSGRRLLAAVVPAQVESLANSPSSLTVRPGEPRATASVMLDVVSPQSASELSAVMAAPQTINGFCV